MPQAAIPTYPPDRPLLGIGLMLGFCVIVPFADALAKILGSDFPLMQLILVRFAAQAILLVPLCALDGGPAFFPNARILRLTAVRAMLQMTGIALMFASLRFLPLADAVAIAFVMPFIMLLLGWFYLGEVVGPAPPRRLRGRLRRHADGGAAQFSPRSAGPRYCRWRSRWSSPSSCW